MLNGHLNLGLRAQVNQTGAYLIGNFSAIVLEHSG